jgi:hypothetical protein
MCLNGCAVWFQAVESDAAIHGHVNVFMRRPVTSLVPAGLLPASVIGSKGASRSSSTSTPTTGASPAAVGSPSADPRLRPTAPEFVPSFRASASPGAATPPPAVVAAPGVVTPTVPSVATWTVPVAGAEFIASCGVDVHAGRLFPIDDVTASYGFETKQQQQQLLLKNLWKAFPESNRGGRGGRGNRGGRGGRGGRNADPAPPTASELLYKTTSTHVVPASFVQYLDDAEVKVLCSVVLYCILLCTFPALGGHAVLSWS